MTKRTMDARLADAIAKDKEALAVIQQRKQRREAQRRTLAQQERHRLRLRWGGILDELGLLDLEEQTLKEALKFAYAVVTNGQDADGVQHVVQLVRDDSPVFSSNGRAETGDHTP